MEDLEMIQALRSLSVETGSLSCLGCGYEHNCGIHGCAIMRTAANLIEQLANDPLTLEELRGRTKPVWCDTPGCSWISEGGYYCLCEKGMITTPSKQTFQAEECLKNGWILLDRKPDGGGKG